MPVSLPTVYVETTVPSYLTARPSRDVVMLAHQRITIDWWSTARDRYDLRVSAIVLNELRQGDTDAAADRMHAVADLSILPINEEILALGQEYVSTLGMPAKSAIDALHLACAVVHKIEYLITWNCRHLANPELWRSLLKANGESGRFTPIIATPENMIEWGELESENDK
jgi:hypothetical protein